MQFGMFYDSGCAILLDLDLDPTNQLQLPASQVAEPQRAPQAGR